MPITKPIVLEPLGLIVDPSKLGQYPDGAMAVAVGIVHRGAGSHQAAPKFVETLRIASDNSADFEKVEVIPVPTGFTLVLAKRSGAWRYCWVNDANTPSAWATPTTVYGNASFEIDGRVSWVLVRDRVLVTSDIGPLMFDYLAPTTDAERAPRLAGMFSPAISTAAVSGDNAGALHAGMQAHTVAIVTRHFPDCYEVSGAMSAAVQTFAPGDKEDDDEADRRNLEITIHRRPGHPWVQPGDVVEVYRTYQTPRPVNDGDPEDYDQGTSTTSQYFMSSTFEIPAGTVEDSYTWTEAVGDQNLGEALYTNDTVAGSSAQKRPPPIARVIEEFRGYTFYFDITEPPARVARAAAGMGELTDDWSQEWGIGTRPGPAYDSVEIDGDTFTLASADDLASCVLCNVDDLARVNPDTPGTKTTPATGFAFRFDYAAHGDFTIRASNGQNYQPPLPTLSEPAELVTRPRRKNGMMWTENGQPEAIVAAGLVGKGHVYGACATSQAMVIWTEYGMHRLSGTGGSTSAGFDWSLDQIDTQVLLRGPKAYCKLGDVVFCASSAGCVVIDGGGNVREISTSALGDIGKAEWSENDNTRVTPDEATGDVHFNFDGDPFTYTYSTRWNKWSRIRLANESLDCSVGNLQTKVTAVEIEEDDIVFRKASPTIRQQTVARCQLLFDGDPASLKRWVEVEWFFEGVCAGEPVTLIVNTLEGIERDLDPFDVNVLPTYIQSGIPASAQGDAVDFGLAQTWMEIPRDAPAISNAISIGYTTPEGTCDYKFFGMSIVCNHQTTTIRRAKGST